MALKNLAKKITKPTSAKAKGIVLDVPEDIAEDIEGWVDNNRTKKDAIAAMEQKEQTILNFAEPAWRDACKKNGGVETSVKVGNLRISWKSKSQFVTSSSLGDGERAKAVFGDDYDKYFTEVDGPMQLTKEAVNDAEIVAKMEIFFEKLQEEHPDTQIITMTTKVIASDAIYLDWVMHKNEEIESKFTAAGIKRTKPTFAQR